MAPASAMSLFQPRDMIDLLGRGAPRDIGL
jgi:hypothetical protein